MLIISLKLDRELLDRIDAAAREDGDCRSESIRRYLGAMMAWRHDRAIWSQAQERGAAGSVPARYALFELIAGGLKALQQSPRATTPHQHPAISVPIRGLRANGSKPSA